MILGSLTLGTFPYRCFDDLFSESADLYSMGNARTIAGGEIRQAGKRINNLKELFNIREGWIAADVDLSPRALAEFAARVGPV